ncbi:methionine synthase [Allonocardiopsis opalescens]|uniref:Cobalamin-independent methionine synthase catalytic subunit n=1 Tax=Allonocardiopsis opalescens TaxID=1144618 RepID=A0A2T0QE47_9ACTN|nr:methionine synthase [Allonocardiopsis opalescens]PRY02123.1 cobalamin-independent methionine synthase catalytic subunit [Allonocardiopsis opalescens]
MSEQREYPWGPAAATGVGSLPGEDPAEAVRIVFGELPELPHLPELPARGVGADMVGRTAGMLVEIPVEVRPSGWRVADRPGRDLARAASHLGRDLDALEEHAGTYTGPMKIQVAGVWTLAATVEGRSGDRLLADGGAVRDLAASLAEGVAAHIERVRRRVPGARLLVQVDEPALPGVLAGTVPTASGFGRLRAVPEPDAEDALRTLLDAVRAAGAAPAVHCCAPGAPIGLLRGAGADALSLDLSLVRRADYDAIGAAVEAGTGFLLGVFPGTDGGDTRVRTADLSDPAANVSVIRELWRRLGFAPDQLARAVAVTPACGLAGASPGRARAVLAACVRGARALRDAPE